VIEVDGGQHNEAKIAAAMRNGQNFLKLMAIVFCDCGTMTG
jgi:hypothetical protein